MSTNDPDIFSTLFRWAHRQNENFTTDAFVYVVRHILKVEPSLGRSFLGWLCLNDATSPVFDNGQLSVCTQWATDEGRPDIRVQNDGFFGLIEVKKDADLGLDQVQRYETILQNQPQPRKSLVFLTVYPMPSHIVIKDQHLHRTWDEVNDWLQGHPPSDSVTAFLVGEFGRFLRSQQMTIDAVTNAYIPGVKALRDLVAMLGKACEISRIPATRGNGTYYQGWWIDGDTFWTGVYIGTYQHEVIIFEINQEVADEKACREAGWHILEDDNWGTVIDLRERPEFFSLPKSDQLKLLTDFVRNAYQLAVKCISVGTGPASAGRREAKKAKLPDNE
jgi:hypothetical protein